MIAISVIGYMILARRKRRNARQEVAICNSLGESQLHTSDHFAVVARRSDRGHVAMDPPGRFQGEVARTQEHSTAIRLAEGDELHSAIGFTVVAPEMQLDQHLQDRRWQEISPGRGTAWMPNLETGSSSHQPVIESPSEADEASTENFSPLAHDASSRDDVVAKVEKEITAQAFLVLESKYSISTPIVVTTTDNPQAPAKDSELPEVASETLEDEKRLLNTLIDRTIHLSSEPAEESSDTPMSPWKSRKLPLLGQPSKRKGNVAISESKTQIGATGVAQFQKQKKHFGRKLKWIKKLF